MCWQTIRRLRDERSHTARSIKQQNGVPLSYEDVLGRWREYFKVLSNPVAVKPSDTQEVRFGRKVSSLQQKSSLLSKYRKLQNAMKSNLKCLKALNKCVLGLLVCSMWPGILGGGDTERLATRSDHPIHKKGDRSECTNYRGTPLLSLSTRGWTKTQLLSNSQSLSNYFWKL